MNNFESAEELREESPVTLTRAATPSSLNRQRSRLLRLLDRYAADIRAGRVSKPIATPVASALGLYRRRLSRDEWTEAVRRDLRPHPIVGCLHEDPYASYGFRKPRGYAGDAVLLDFIYGGGACTEFVNAASPVGVALYRECLSHPSFAAIRKRRDHLADRLAAVCQIRRRPHILSVACGHVREAESLKPLDAGRLPGRFVVMDQDPETLKTAISSYPGIALEPVQASVLSLLRSRQEYGQFDFIYSAGLYDYLSDSVARRLTAKLVQMLKPRGCLLIANMLPDLPASAYMEAVMDWWLIYRTLPEFKLLAGRTVPAGCMTVYQQRHVGYMEIARGSE